MDKYIGNDAFKALLEASNKQQKVLSGLNNELLNQLSNNSLQAATLFAGRNHSELVEASSHLVKAMAPYSEKYKAVFSESPSLIASKAMASKLSQINVNTGALLSQTKNTKMIDELTRSFAQAKYYEMPTIINYHLSSFKIPAVDVAFLKSSQIANSFQSEIKYPKGMKTSLRQLNVTTANDLLDNEDIDYNLENNQFEYYQSSINSVGMNIVCSGNMLLNSSSDEELFQETELMAFVEVLFITPTFGSSNPTGEKIFNAICSFLSRGEYIIDFDFDCYYHARSRDLNRSTYSQAEMMQVPARLANVGRYNHPGRSHYYFSNTTKGAYQEVKRHLHNSRVIQIAKLIPIDHCQLLDISRTNKIGKTFLNYLRFPFDDSVQNNMPKEYLLPCYVSDCCKRAGLDGIKYYGSKEYFNYVTWHDSHFYIADTNVPY